MVDSPQLQICCKYSGYQQSAFIISVLPKGRSFTGNSGTKTAVLSKDRSSTANSGTKVAVLLEMNRCGSFPYPILCLASGQTLKDLKRSYGQQRGSEESEFG